MEASSLHDLAPPQISSRCQVDWLLCLGAFVGMNVAHDCMSCGASVQGAANRVLLGLLPSSEIGWPTAVTTLKPQGGWLHIHGNVNRKVQTPEEWAGETTARIQAIAGNAKASAVLALTAALWVLWLPRGFLLEPVPTYTLHGRYPAVSCLNAFVARQCVHAFERAPTCTALI